MTALTGARIITNINQKSVIIIVIVMNIFIIFLTINVLVIVMHSIIIKIIIIVIHSKFTDSNQLVHIWPMCQWLLH